MQARNPELVGGIFETGSNTAGFLVGAPAEAESNSWFMTEELLKNVPNDWKVPNLSQFGDDAGRARGADAALATADPTYALSLTTLSGRPPLANGVAKVVSRTDTQGGIWVLTDLRDGNALGMTVVKIANQAGEFVPVDQASVTAGVKSMKPTDNGMLLPDPTAVTKVDGTTPYPLAFVEYAMVPAEPLVDKDCKARDDSQALLTEVAHLRHRTTARRSFRAGMFPLTPDLQAQGGIRHRPGRQGPGHRDVCRPGRVDLGQHHDHDDGADHHHDRRGGEHRRWLRRGCDRDVRQRPIRRHHRRGPRQHLPVGLDCPIEPCWPRRASRSARHPRPATACS